MKLKGLTDTDDYHWSTLLWAMRHGEWLCGTQWSAWHLSWEYVWYDGPNWSLQLGPVWVALDCGQHIRPQNVVGQNW